jgi:superfamily II DNA or RNA helicase
MRLTREQIATWANAEVAAQGHKLYAAGAVQGVQSSGEVIGGSLKIGAARIVTRLSVREGKPRVQCACAVAQQQGMCAHAIALALAWVNRQSGDVDQLKFSAEQAPTLVQIERWADPTTVTRAQRLVKSGAVSQVRFAYPEGSAVVEGNRVRLQVSFKMLPSGLAEGKCLCSDARDRGLLCEHIVAAMLAVMHIYGNDERRKLYEEERARVMQLNQAKDLIQQSARGKEAKLRVLLPSPVSLKEAFYQDKVRIGILISAAGKSWKPQDLPREPYHFSEGDAALIGVFEDIAGGAFRDTMTLSKSDALAVLHCAATSWVGFASTRKQLIVSRERVVTPIWQRPRHRTNFCFLIAGAEIRPVAGTLPLPYQAVYHEMVRIPRDGLVGFYRTELPKMTAALPLDEASVPLELFTTTPGEPKFLLELDGDEQYVTGRLTACYGNYHVKVGSPEEISQPDPDDFYHCYVRNRDAERSALEYTQAMGFYGSDGSHLGTVSGMRAIRNLLGEHIPMVRRAGWSVILHGSIERSFDAAEMIVPVVTAVPTATGDAYELTTVYEAPQGKITVTPAEIERALAHGNAYLEKEGELVLIDLDALRTLRKTLTSCRASAGVAPGSSRVEAVHVPFVESMVASLEGIVFESHPNWRKRAAVQNREDKPQAVDLGRLEGTLRPYQKEGVYWLRFLETCGFCGVLADEMGLGKTLQTLTWLQLPRCREEARRAPALIVCPTSLVENWRREAMKFVPWLRWLVLSGPDRASQFEKVATSDLVITSYALIRRDADFHAQSTYSAVVLDEAQAIKNQRTQNAQAVKRLRSDTRLVLSGTPIENGVSDLWSIMDFLMPDYLGRYDDFKVVYEDAVEMGGRSAENAQAQLRKKLHPFLLRRVKKDVAPDLPDKIRSVVYCELSAAQRQAYDRIREHVRTRMRNLVKEKGFDKSRFEVLADLMRLRQICCDVALLEDYQMTAGAESSAKLNTLMELLAEARSGGHRMLVFSQFTSMLKRIAERLAAEGIRYCYLDGATKHRLDECARFNQDTSIPIFLISLKAGGTGLNLTGADMVVHFDPWWNPAAEEQATDRAHRIGQKRTVQAIKLIAQDTIEEKVLEMQRKKQSLIDATVNASDGSIVSTLTMAEIEDLLS